MQPKEKVRQPERAARAFCLVEAACGGEAGSCRNSCEVGKLLPSKSPNVLQFGGMPEPFRKLPPLTLTFGPCPKCKQPLRLGVIEPAETGHDKRLYEYASCGHSEIVTLKYR